MISHGAITKNENESKSEYLVEEFVKEVCRNTPRVNPDSGVVFSQKIGFFAKIYFAKVAHQAEQETLERIRGLKKRTIENMLLDDPLYQKMGMDGVRGYNDGVMDAVKIVETTPNTPTV